MTLREQLEDRQETGITRQETDHTKHSKYPENRKGNEGDCNSQAQGNLTLERDETETKEETHLRNAKTLEAEFLYMPFRITFLLRPTFQSHGNLK